MTRATCDYLPPARGPFADLSGSIESCPLLRGHAGDHMATTPDGKCYAWSSEDDCGCCDITDPDRCFGVGEWPLDWCAQIAKVAEEVGGETGAY